MKIKDILGEDDFGKIAAISPDKITIDKPDGTKLDVAKAAVMPDPNKQGSATIDPAAAGDQLKPGMEVDTATQEDIGGDATDDFINDVVDHEYGVQEAGEVETIPTKDFIKGIYDIAAQHGADAPNPEEVKKLMVLTANGEVDVNATFQKLVDVFNQRLPELEKVLNDLQAILDTPEAQAAMKQAPSINESSDDQLLAQMVHIAGVKSKGTTVKRSAELNDLLTIAGLR